MNKQAARERSLHNISIAQLCRHAVIESTIVNVQVSLALELKQNTLKFEKNHHFAANILRIFPQNRFSMEYLFE